MPVFSLQVMKLDVTSGETWKFSEEHIYCAAPVFISRPDAVVSKRLSQQLMCSVTGVMLRGNM